MKMKSEHIDQLVDMLAQVAEKYGTHGLLSSIDRFFGTRNGRE